MAILKVTTDMITDDAVTGGKLNPPLVAGDVLYADGTDTITRLAAGTNDDVLTLAGGVPTWAEASGGGGGGTVTNRENWCQARIWPLSISMCVCWAARPGAGRPFSTCICPVL